MSVIVSDHNANLEECPVADEKIPLHASNQSTIGDMHGNALKFLLFLIRQHILTLPNPLHARLVAIYKKNIEKLTRNDINEFNSIIAKAMINSNAGMSRLIGDELADRGANDYFTLKIIEKLNQAGVPLEIMLSNHSIEFIEDAETTRTLTPPRLLAMHASSMFALKRLVQRGIVNKDEIYDIYEQHYKSHLKALSYTLNENKTKISIYSHAAIDLSVIRSIAHKLQIPFNDALIDKPIPAELAAIIDEINTKFHEHVLNDTVHTLYSQQVMRTAYEGKFINHETNPFEFLMWNRHYDGLRRPAQYANDNAVDFVHGHDPNDPEGDNIFDLDKNNDLGKTSDQNKGEYRILFSNEISSHVLNNAWNPWRYKNPDIQHLYKHIIAMRTYGYSLRNEDAEKGQSAIDLSINLLKSADAFFKENKPTAEAGTKFHSTFHKLLHSKDNEMATHRKVWKPIVSNIAIALSLVGLFAIIGQLIYSKVTTGTASFFFAKTNRQQQIDKIDDCSKRVRQQVS